MNVNMSVNVGVSVSFILSLFCFFLSFPSYSQDLSYDDLLQELHYKQARLSRFNRGDSLSQKSVSFGFVSSVNAIKSPHSSLVYPWLQGFEFGLNSDLGSTDLEGRTLFRYFFENQKSQSLTSLREITFQGTKSQLYNPHWNWFYGGGFSLRHLLHDSGYGALNEVSIQLNAITGFETKLSSTSRIAFEVGSRFPFGVTGQDRISLDAGFKLKTDMD
jgi:hypothetical protein